MVLFHMLVIAALLVLVAVLGYFTGHASGVADEKANAQLLRELDAE